METSDGDKRSSLVTNVISRVRDLHWIYVYSTLAHQVCGFAGMVFPSTETSWLTNAIRGFAGDPSPRHLGHCLPEEGSHPSANRS
jgi:hypothetical protein